MRIFKTKWFTRYAAKTDIDDESLVEAVERANSGLVDAKLGGNVIKLRIPRKGQGRSSGYRTLIAYHKNKRAIFLYGFAKNERENIDDIQLESLKEMALAWLKLEEKKINSSLNEGLLQEVIYDKKT